MVEPLKPAERKRLAARGTPEEIDEYERLLVARFAHDPSIEEDLGEEDEKSVRDASRLAVLAEKLFGKRRP